MTESSIVNISEVPLADHGNGGIFTAKIGRIGRMIGSTGLGCAITVLPPGKRAYPLHRHHVIHELFYILSGAGEYRLGDRVLPLRAGASLVRRTLPELAADWAAETFGVRNARPYVAIPRGQPRYLTINLGVGENPAKRLPDPFEEELIALLAATGAHLVIDKGPGGEEAARVERAVQRAGVRAQFWEGSFAGFARLIAESHLYVGYDSAGQHVAAALGVPLISIFAGFPALRMFHRWKPAGTHSTVIRVDNQDPTEILNRVRAVLPA